MGEILPFGFPLDYPEHGGHFEQLMHQENARIVQLQPVPGSPAWLAHQQYMHGLAQQERHAITIGRIRRRRLLMLAVASFFGRHLPATRAPWEDAADWRSAMSALTLAAGLPPTPFDAAGFRRTWKAVDEYVRWKNQTDAEVETTQNNVDRILASIIQRIRRPAC